MKNKKHFLIQLIFLALDDDIFGDFLDDDNFLVGDFFDDDIFGDFFDDDNFIVGDFLDDDDVL
jgi:hypothetical protein